MTRFGLTGIAQILICLLVVVLGTSSMMSFGVFVPGYVQSFESDVGTVSLAASVLLLG